MSQDAGNDLTNHVPFYVAQAAYNNTWVSRDLLNNVLSTTQGSLAGMPLADIVYALPFSVVLKMFLDALTADDLVPVYEHPSLGGEAICSGLFS